MSLAKTERLLDIVALLLKSGCPVSKAAIRKTIPHYAGLEKDQSFDRVFERDKAELRAMGIAVKVYRIEDRQEIASPQEAAKYRAEEIGYLIDRDEYFLPQLDFSAEEWAAIALVSSTARQSRDRRLAGELASLVQKVNCQRPEGLDPRQDVAVSAGQRADAQRESRNLETLQDAVRDSTTVEFNYYSIHRDSTATRQVDPYLLTYHAGAWYLVGRCHLRGGIRVFKLSRVGKLKLLKGRPGFAIPADFDRREYIGRKAWELAVGPEVAVRLEVDPEQAWLVRHQLGERAEWDQSGKSATVAVSNTEPFVRWACANADRVSIAGPEDLALRVAERLQRVALLYKDS